MEGPDVKGLWFSLPIALACGACSGNPDLTEEAAPPADVPVVVAYDQLPPLTAANGETITDLRIDGMHCPACQRSVTAELEALAGTRQVVVDLDLGAARVVHADDLTVDQLTAAVAKTGNTALPR